MLSASQRRPSRSGGTCNSWSRLPSAPNRQTSSRRRLKSSPACNMIFQASLWFGLTPSSVHSKAPPREAPFMTIRLSGEYPAQPGEGGETSKTLSPSMKGAVVSMGQVVALCRLGAAGRVDGWESSSSLYRVLGVTIWWIGAVARRRNSHEGRLGDQGERGACRSEGLVSGQHVPDGLGQLAGDLNRADLGATLAQALTGSFVLGSKVGRPGGVPGSLDERPAQVARTVLGQRPALVVLPGLTHPGTQAGVAAELGG